MLRVFAAVPFILLFVGSSPTWADDCYPHCDWSHDYGPYDFTYIRPGLFAYPICGPRQDCSPHLRYTYQRGYPLRERIIIRPRSRPVAVRPRP
jgi:hypothetical protein